MKKQIYIATKSCQLCSSKASTWLCVMYVTEAALGPAAHIGLLIDQLTKLSLCELLL